MSAVTDGLKQGWAEATTSFRNTPGAVRKFFDDPKTAVGGASIVPLIVLMGHSFIDALDGAGFAVILPEIQKDFDLTVSQISGVGGIALIVSFMLGIPIAVKSEATTRRTLYLGAGAVVAAVFAFMSGIAGSLGLFLFARSGFGLGLRLNDPVQQSLLSDYYPVSTRSTVFSARDGLTRAGRLVGPLFFGIVTAIAGWRTAVLSIAFPSAVLAFYSFRLRNPVRGAPEREAAGLPAVEVEKIENPPSLREAFRVLKKIGTVRRLWFSLPFLTGSLLSLAILTPQFLEKVFHLDPAGRGVVSAIGEAGAILGLIVATPVMTRYLMSPNPERVFPFLSKLSVVVACVLLLEAVSPNVYVFTAVSFVANFAGAVLAPALVVLLSMVVPPRVRTISFATLAFFILPGLLTLPFAGGIGDQFGLRWAIALSIPVLLGGALIITTGKKLFVQDVNGAMMAMQDEFQAQAAILEAERAALVVQADSPVNLEPMPPKAAVATKKRAPAKRATAAKKAPAKKAPAKKAAASKKKG